MHPTHHLKNTISFKWLNTKQTLDLQQDSSNKKDACYPAREVSRKLSWGNWKFVLRNPDFFPTLGALYWIGGLILLAWRGYRPNNTSGAFIQNVWEQIALISTTPSTLLVLGVFIAGIIRYADITPDWMKYLVGGIHGAVHGAIILSSTACFSVFLSPLLSVPFGELTYFAAFALCMTLGAGLVGGVIWGLYLLAVSYLWAMHANDAFSAMRLNSYRHFLRMHISGDILTVYPIGIDETPPMSQWEFADDPTAEKPSILRPKQPLNEYLIEEPIVIDASKMGDLT